MSSVAFDLTSMFVSGANDTPRGIDRVDMGYAKRFFADSDGSNLGLLPSAAGMGALSAIEAHEFVGAVERRWRETTSHEDDEQTTDWLLRRLAGERAPARRRGRRASAQLVLRYARLAMRARRTVYRPATRMVAHGAVYVNTGQVLLRYGSFFDWLEKRRDVRPVFMMHDLIPILFPEYCGPEEARRHERSVDTLARRAAAMIATSETSAADIRAALAKRGRSDIPIHVAHLPVDDAFLVNARGQRFAGGAPYFVIVSSIDQRKNHLVVLNAWREIARRAPSPKPKLVIIGARGRRSAGVVDFLRRCPALAEHVIEVNGLSTPVMRELVRDARALLMPSFAEGYGLPIVEALALRTPVIASDIAAHREVGRSWLCYLDALDGAAWAAELIARAQESEAETLARRAALATFAPQTWNSYFDQVLPFIASL